MKRSRPQPSGFWHLFLAGLVLACGLTATVPVLAATFADDRREPLPLALAGLKDRIGLLADEGTRTVCTAFCVAPDLVVTAAHCVFHRGQGLGPSKPANIWFSLDGMKSNNRVRISGVDSGNGLGSILAGTTRLRLKPPIDATDDWAAVRLAEPVCDRGVLPLKPLPPDDLLKAAAAGRVYQVAFHDDFRDWQLALNRSCDLQPTFEHLDAPLIQKEFSDPRNLVLHRCDTSEGSSGSPLLLDEAGGPYVVAINVGTYLQSRVLVRDGAVVKSFAPETIANTGVNVTEFADQVARFRTPDTLTRIADVKRLQALLAARKLYAGAIDGILGEQTRTAIRAIQRELGEVQTGLPDIVLFERLGLGGVDPMRTANPAVQGQQVPSAASEQQAEQGRE